MGAVAMMTTQEFLQIDLPAMTAAVLACISCALVGNFLVLRRQSMLGDAISHAILPGIVVGFLVTGSRAGLPVIIGALAAAVLARRPDRSRAPAGPAGRRGRHGRGVHRDVRGRRGPDRAGRRARGRPGCRLRAVWTARSHPVAGATRWSDLADPAVWADLPHQVVVLAAVALLCVVCVTLFYKELALTSFDPNLATTLGYPAGLFHYGVVVLVAVAAIASFEAVGSILVVAMLICPAATARLLTDRLPVQLWLSVLIGGITGAGGYLLGAFGPSVLAGDRRTR